MRVRTALTIAGSDCGGGAGIQADLKTFVGRGVYGMSVVTALTAQNTRGVRSVSLTDPAMVRDQLLVIFEDFPVDAVKTGMLGSAAVVHVVCDVLERLPSLPPLVVDPVMFAKDGSSLLDPGALEALRLRLIPLATLVTPNLPEAEVLGPLAGAHLVKGGHAQGTWVEDVLRHNDTRFRYRHRRVDSVHTHGTGCTLSAAIAAELAKGVDLEVACGRSIRYVSRLVRRSAQGSLGGGFGPLLHGLCAR